MSTKKELSMRDTIEEMRELLSHITSDLEKSDNGNKAASQRVRTGTVKLEKIAKHYRKVSIHHERNTKGQKKNGKPSAGKATAANGKASVKAKAPANKLAPKSAAKPAVKAKAAAKTSAKPAAKPAAKAAAKPKAASKTVAKPHAFALRRPTAKLPVRKSSAR